MIVKLGPDDDEFVPKEDYDTLKSDLQAARAEVEKWKDEYSNVCKFATDYEDKLTRTEAALAQALQDKEAKARGDATYHEHMQREWHRERTKLREALEVAKGALKDYEDINNSGGPNLAMRALAEIEEILKAP